MRQPETVHLATHDHLPFCRSPGPADCERRTAVRQAPVVLEHTVLLLGLLLLVIQGRVAHLGVHLQLLALSPSGQAYLSHRMSAKRDSVVVPVRVR